MAAILSLSYSARAVSKPFQLGGPDVIKVDWNTRGLIAHDLDGNALTDLILINNDRARIDMLYQYKPGEKPAPSLRSGRPNRWDPVLEDAHFHKVHLVTGNTAYALAAGDMNHDGLIDLIYTGKPDPVTVCYQAKGGDWSRKRVIDVESVAHWTSTLRVRDLNGDKRSDLVVLSKKSCLLFEQNNKGELLGPRRYPLSDHDCYGLEVMDINQDGRPDLLYLAPQHAHALRARMSLSHGGFGPERMFSIKRPKSLIAPVLHQAAKPSFAVVEGDTGLAAIYAFSSEQQDQDKNLLGLPMVFSTSDSAKSHTVYAMGDVNGDRLMDILFTNPKASRIYIHFQDNKGDFKEAESFPTFSDVRSIACADLDGDGQSEVLVASTREAILGYAAFTKKGRLRYPKPIPLAGKPLALATADLDDDTQAEIACVYQGEDGQRYVAVLDRSGDRSWQPHAVLLQGVRTDPKAVKILDANQDSLKDLAIFIPHEPMRILLQDAQNHFTDISSASGYRKGMVDKLDAAAVSVGDVDGDGKQELLVAGTGFARSIRITDAHALEVMDQYNTLEAETKLSAVVPVDLDGDEVKEIILVDQKGESFEIMRQDVHGVYRHLQTVALGTLDLVDTAVVDLNGDGGQDLLFFGKDRFWWFPLTRDHFDVHRVTSYETDLDEVFITDIATGDFNDDGRQDLITLDTKKSHILEILSGEQPGALYSAMHFTVFESDLHYRGRKGTKEEPREMIVTDLKGNGRAALILLVHDRILVYPQR